MVKKTFHIDEQLFQEAKAACNAVSDTETIRQGLQALVRHAAYQRLRSLRGTEADAVDVARRREKPVVRRKAS